MGIIYSIACKDCKVTRDLDKLDSMRFVGSRKDALKYSEYLESKKILFREGLLLSFMAEHIGHECVLFNEHLECNEELDPIYKATIPPEQAYLFKNETVNDYKKDTDFW